MAPRRPPPMSPCRAILAGVVGRVEGGAANRSRVGSAPLERTSTLCLALLLGGLIACCWPHVAHARSAAPNILFIVTDDQRAADTMDAMPSTSSWFRQRGTYFPNAVATTPLCCPSRASIFSGRYAHNTGVRSNLDGDHLDQSTTLQRYLKDAGYRTGLFGKFLNTWRLRRNPPHWDSWATGASGYLPYLVNEQGVVRSVNRYSTDYIRDQALSFLAHTESTDKQPWFMYVATPAPHAPFTPADRHSNAPVPQYDPNPAFYERNGASNDLSDKPHRVVDGQAVDQQAFDSFILGDPFDPVATPGMRAQQLRSLMAVDELVSRVFSTLVTNGEERDTIAFFISDNGVMWGEHGLRGKGWPYLDSVRIPFYVHAPGEDALPPGTVDSDLAANIDLAPTALDAAGVTPAEPMDGVSLLDPANNRDRVLLEYWGQDQDFPWASTLTREHQYTEYYRGDGADPVTDANGTPVREYYDLTSDPWQLDNLLGDTSPLNDPMTAALSTQLAQDRLCSGSGLAPPACPPGPGAIPPQDQIAPSVSLELPPNGVVVSGRVPVQAEAIDNVGVAGVQFAVDGQPLQGDDTVAPFGVFGGWDSDTKPQWSVHQITATARDAAGNRSTARAAVVVYHFDVQTSAGDGRLNDGDSITYRFPGAVDPGSIMTGWTGLVPQTVSVMVNREAGSAPDSNDTVTVNGTNQGALGTIDLGRYDYANGAGSGIFTSSTMTMPGSRTVKIELGGGSIAGTGTDGGVMRWSVGTATDMAGLRFCACQAMESGHPPDREF